MSRCEVSGTFLGCAAFTQTGRTNNAMDSAARHRLLLSLRSEQALGLRSIVRGSFESDADVPPLPVEPAMVSSPERSTRQTSPTAPATLYGQPATPPALPV